MQIADIINLICIAVNSSPNSVVKRKFGKLPEYTYQDILTRVISTGGGRIPISDIFPEMSRPTASKMLAKAFPGKSSPEQSWYNYLIGLAGLKRCRYCSTLYTTDRFYKATSKFGGLKDVCIDCDKYLNKAHREPNRDHDNRKRHEHYLLHKAEHLARKIQRRDRKKLATPSWANVQEMNRIYYMCPEGYHVDHIIPLQGTHVSGLHTEHNLQYLPATINISKGNKFDPDTYKHILEYVPPYI